jgi:hypothetical protein
VFGCLFTCLGGFLVYPIAILTSAGGVAVAFLAKGPMKVAGIAFNGLTLLLSIVMTALFALALVGNVAAGR